MSDKIKHPSHYTQYKTEVIDITRHLPFCLGNVVKYVLRAPYKNGQEDIEKALQYLEWCDEKPVEVPQACLDAIDAMRDEIPHIGKHLQNELYAMQRIFLLNIPKFMSGYINKDIMTDIIRLTGEAIVFNTKSALKERIYLAAPYSSPHATIRQMRYEAVTSEVAELMTSGAIVFSPVTHGHPLADRCPDTPGFWKRWYMTFLEKWATQLYVLQLPEWDKSKGVAAEMKYAKEHNIPITFIPNEE